MSLQRVVVDDAPKTRKPTAEILSKFSLFNGLKHDQLARVSRSLHSTTLPPGAIILSFGQSAGKVYLLVTGLVRITVPNGNGKESILALRGPGEVLGEIDFSDGKGHSASVIVEQEASLLWMECEALRDYLRSIPALAHNLERLLARQARRATDQRRSACIQDPCGRVASQLVMMARDIGLPHNGGGIFIPARLTPDILGQMAGTSRPTAHRALTTLKEGKYIFTIPDHRIVVRDLTALEARLQDACRV